MDITILSFDLGNSLGIALSIYNTNSRIFKVIRTDLYYIDKYIKDNNLIVDNFFNRNAIKILAFKNILNKYINSITPLHKIDIFVTEDAFIYSGRLTAYKSLSLYINTLDEYVNIYHNKDLIRLAPKYIKYIFSNNKKGKANKLDMKIALKNINNISIKNIDVLSEHEIDAIAVGYTYITELIKINYI